VYRLVFWSSKQAKELRLMMCLAMSVVWLVHIPLLQVGFSVFNNKILNRVKTE